MVSFKVRPFMCVHVYFSGSELRCSDYYTSHPPFDSASNVAIAAVGTVSLAIEYGEVSISACSGTSMNLMRWSWHRFFLLLCSFQDIQIGFGHQCGVASRSTSSLCSLLASLPRYGFVSLSNFRSPFTSSLTGMATDSIPRRRSRSRGRHALQSRY